MSGARAIFVLGVLGVLGFALGATAGCGFNSSKFDDRSCNSSDDCRPDQACTAGVCTESACTAATDCGSAYEFECTAGLCVAHGCSAPADCALGFACVATFCQASFNVASAASAGNASLAVTFDAPPDPATATTVAHYAVSGLTLTGTPTLVGSTVTLTTSVQAATSYTLTVSDVTRASDGAPLTVSTATFTGRSGFDVASAASTSSGSLVVTFDAPPTAAQATALANYTIPGLTLSGTPSLTGNAVTLATSPQANMTYTVTVAGVSRASDGEALQGATASFTGRAPFNVASADATSSGALTVTFDAPPNAAQATTLANYTVPGLTLSGAPTLSGNTVTLVTSEQTATPLTVTVSGVTRAGDGEPLTIATANFTGIGAFDVASAAPVSSESITVTFDAPPDLATATTLANYTVDGLTLGGTPVLSGNTVTLVTSPQAAIGYTVTVAGVVRASDSEPLTVDTAAFTGRAPFDVTAAASTSSKSLTVTFQATPDPAQATTLANYAIPGLTVSGTPTLSGNTVTLATSPQSATTFTVSVSGVTRASDAEALTVTTASFAGTAPFDVTAAASLTSHSFAVTFDAPPNAAQATSLANYSIPGLALTGAPSLSGNTVTITTSAQSATTFGVTVSGVARASDGEPLSVASASFVGRTPFDVAGAASTSNNSLTVTFDAPPSATAATTLTNYTVPGLTLTGTPTLSGNTVTIGTSTQAVTTYTVTATNVTRATDGEPLTTTAASFTGRTGFNVASAASTGRTTMTVTFDAPPNVAQATTLANYNVPGLTLSGTPALSGSTVTITTATQAAGSHTVTVTGVTRASDAEVLTIASASFIHASFNVGSAAAASSHSIAVTFDAPPTAAQATTLANYSVPGLTLSGTPALSGSTVTLTTSAQTVTTFTVTVTNVTRASDGEPLATTTGTFTGRAPFDVASAASTSSVSIKVTFDAAPDPTTATSLSSYAVPNLSLSGTPILSGNTVTLSTTAQNNKTFTVTVSGVTRASDGEPLTVNAASFTGTAVQKPTVTNVVVGNTTPDNGSTFFNTGTATVHIIGTDLATVACPSGVALDDLDGAGVGVGTHPISCTVDSDTRITATFPAGIRTNGALGWNVKVTNSVGGNSTSTVHLVPVAGLLVSEIFPGGTAAASTHQFVEIYNPTATALNLTSLGVHLHVRTAAGTDTDAPLTITRGTIPATGGFLLIASSQSTAGDAWFSHLDATFSALTNGLTANGGVYLSLSSTANAKVLDKAGWGSQGTGGREGTAIANIPPANSAQRKPAGGAGAATDTDNNSTDFLAPSTSLTPLGTADPPQH